VPDRLSGVVRLERLKIDAPDPSRALERGPPASEVDDLVFANDDGVVGVEATWSADLQVRSGLEHSTRLMRQTTIQLLRQVA
jgi:hypothetical protein